VRFLDYQKVRDVEREKAAELFGTASEPSALASKVRCNTPTPHPIPIPILRRQTNPSPIAQIMGVKSRTFDIPSAGGTLAAANGAAASGDKTYRVKLTEKEKKRVEKLIRNAKSLQEIARLEKELNEGKIPGGTGAGDEMEE